MQFKFIFIILGVLVLFVGYSSFFVVDERNQVVITQFGKPVGDPVTTAGLNFKLPFIQKITYFDKRILKWDGKPNEIPTNDKTFIWVDTTARWRIVKPLVFLQRLNNTDRALSVLSNIIDGAVRDLITRNDLIEIILSSDWRKEYAVSTEAATRESRVVTVGRDRFSNLVLEAVKQLTTDYGIEVLDVLVKRLNYTQQVRERVYDRMISERQRIAAEIRSEGEGEKAEILGKLERELNTIQSEAFRESETIRGTADALATRIYGQAYGAAPEFYAFYSTLESYKTILKENSKLIIDADSDIYKYIKDQTP